MTPYFLLRDNKQSGPYSLEQLKSLDLRPTDLLWKEGGNPLWRNPNELDELLPFLNFLAESREVFELTEPGPVSSTTPGSENGINLEVPADVMNEKEPEYTESIASPPVPAKNNNHEVATTAGPIDRHPATPIKVIIADDHSLFREGVKLALSHQKDIEVIAEAETGVHLLNLLKHHTPDVILLDIEMPVMDGITALKEIRKHYGKMKVIILSMHDARSMVTTLMKSGANSYLSKSADSATIYKAIKGVHANDFHYTDLSSRSMIESLKEEPKNVVKERVAKTSQDKTDMMLKLRDMNKRHTVRMPSRKRKKRSMMLLVVSIITAVIVLGIFYINDQAPKNKIMYAGPFPESAVKPGDNKQVPANTVPATPAESNTINDLLREQDSIIQSRRTINLPKQVQTNTATPTKPKKVKRDRVEEPAREPEPVVSHEPEKVDVPVQKPVDTVVVKDKAVALYQLRNQLSVLANDYGKGVFGGVYDIQLTVTNRSPYRVDDVTIQLEYLLAGKKVHRTTILHARDIPPSSSKVIEAPKNARGVSIQYFITSCSSKEIE